MEVGIRLVVVVIILLIVFLIIINLYTEWTGTSLGLFEALKDMFNQILGGQSP